VLLKKNMSEQESEQDGGAVQALTSLDPEEYMRQFLSKKVDPDTLVPEKRVKNMIVRTKLAGQSGNESTDMHSKTGKSTINMYKQFRNLSRKIPI